MVYIPHQALFLSLFTDRNVLLSLAGYDHHTMPELTWDHLHYPQLSPGPAAFSRGEKQISSTLRRDLPWVQLAVVRPFGVIEHRQRE